MPTVKQAAIGVVFVVAVMVLALYSSNRDGDAGTEREAVAQCEGFADKRLKAPDEAEYDLAATSDGDQWVVTGTVDAENSFGAKVRSDVTCELHFDGDTAVLDNITVG